jgi:pantetheine-phosphate adenylyltransferase
MKIADELYIGITSRSFAGKYKCYDISEFNIRRERVIRFIESMRWRGVYRIFPLEDPYGPTIHEEDIDILLVTPETYKTGVRINNIRRERGFKPLQIIVTDYLMNEHGYPINSTLIKLSYIDAWGRRIT